jgi:hypothetical protein
MYFVIAIRWSQTDHDNIIVHASTEQEALGFVEKKFSGYRYIEIVETAAKIFEAK